MSPVDRRALERLRYWRGQTLRSRDFRDQARLDARRRQLHNRVLHDGPGVSFGLTVSVQTASPLVLGVECGLAYDCAGRELIVQRPREISAPAHAAWLILRRRPDAPAPSTCCPPTDPGCMAEGALDLEGETELAWQSEGVLDPVDGVALARVTPAGHDASFRPRRARPLARPRLARGQTVRGNTPWERWAIDEPDGRGGLRKKVIGVQTFIDTAAAGFTATPCYFATLDSPAWDLATSEFAPAFFPQVADPSVDGFTFRLLMVETARRRYHAAFGTARVVNTSRGVGDRLVIELDDAAPFRKADAVALLRPRGESASMITDADDLALTLNAPLTGVEAGTTMLAVGNVPRTAVVSDVTAQDPAVLVAFTVAAGRAPRRNDVLVRLTDNATTVVNRVVSGALRVEQPFAGWTKDDAVGFALSGSPLGVKSAAVVTGGAKVSIVLRQANHNLAAGESLVLLSAQKAPLAVGKVVAVAGDTIDVQTPLAPALIAELTHAALVRTTMAIQSVQPQNPGIVVTVDRPGAFREGDVVAAAADVSKITMIDKINGTSLSLQAPIPLTKGVSRLVAANWLGATSVDQLAAAGPPGTIRVARADAVPLPSFVVRKEDDGFSAPSIVTAASGTSVTMNPLISGLARLDTLAIGVFPRVVTVVVQEQPDRFQIAEPGALAQGDILARLGAVPALLVRVGAVNGATVVVIAPLDGLHPGDQLGVVGFRDAVRLVGITTPTSITVDRDIDARDGDFVAVLTHYADNGNPGVIEDISGQTLTLIPGLFHGDGIVPEDWIDGGILGPAAVSAASPFQPWTRLEPSDGLEQTRAATAFGLDLETGLFRSSPVYPYLVDAATGRVVVWPIDWSAPYRYRPETLSVVTTFNTDFPSAFATFAQRQALAVSWIGCQDELPRASGCPGVRAAADPCAAITSAEG